MKRILLALALLSPALAGAQDLSHPWILQECLDWALEHNLNVKQSELNVAQREIQLNTSKNAYFPNVSGSANENVNFGRGLTEDNTYTTGATTTNTSFSIGAGMNLFDGMARPNNVKLSQLNLDAALADLERARDDIRVSVAKAYVQVLYDYDIVDVAKDQLKLDQAQVERLQAMVENGKASQAELSQQKATLAQSDFTLVQAENNLRNALLDLSQLLDFPNADGFSIVKPEIAVGDHLLARPEDIYADAVEQRPGVKAEQIRLNGSDLSIKIAKAGFSPTLSLSGGMGTSYYTNTRSLYPQDGFWQQLSHNFSPYVGLSLSVPIFDRFSARNNVRTARLNRTLQQITLDNWTRRNRACTRKSSRPMRTPSRRKPSTAPPPRPPRPPRTPSSWPRPSTRTARPPSRNTTRPVPASPKPAPTRPRPPASTSSRAASWTSTGVPRWSCREF